MPDSAVLLLLPVLLVSGAGALVFAAARRRISWRWPVMAAAALGTVLLAGTAMGYHSAQTARDGGILESMSRGMGCGGG